MFYWIRSIPCRTIQSALLVLPLIAGPNCGASAQTYPAKPVTIVVPSTAGGGMDITARMIARELQNALEQPFVVENKGGASGNIGMTAAKRAAPDGYTLVLTISGYMVSNPALFSNLQWDPKDFAGVAMVLRAPGVLVVSNDFPASNLSELVAYAKANPGKLNYASAGVGTMNQLGAEHLGQVAGIKIQPVLYRGTTQALQDVMAGTVNMFVNPTQALIGPIQNKQVKPIALLGPNRLPMLPDVPTAREQGFPQVDIDTWYALYAPAGTPKAVLDVLASAIKRITDRPDFAEGVRKTGSEMFFKGPTETDQFTKEQLDYWGGVIRTLGIKIP